MKIGGYTGKLIDPKLGIEGSLKGQMFELRFFYVDLYVAWGKTEQWLTSIPSEDLK